VTPETLSDRATCKTLGNIMTHNLTVRPNEATVQDLNSSEDRPKIVKTQQKHFVPNWKRNQDKIIKNKKIGEVSRAKGPRH